MYETYKSVPAIQLVCHALASRQKDKIDFFFRDCLELCEGAKIMSEFPDGRCRLNRLDYVWEIFPKSASIPLRFSLYAGQQFGIPKVRIVVDRAADHDVVIAMIKKNSPFIRELESPSSPEIIKALEGNTQIETLMVHRALCDVDTIQSISTNRTIKRLTLELGDYVVTKWFCLLMRENYDMKFLRITIPADDESLLEVLHLMKNHPSLRFVELTQKKIPINDKALEILETLLIENTTLEVLKMGGCRFSRDQKLKILSALEQNRTIQCFHGLRSNGDDSRLKEIMNYHQRVI